MLELHKRAAMPAALYSLFGAYALEAAALVFATVINFGVLGSEMFRACYTEEELAQCVERGLRAVVAWRLPCWRETVHMPRCTSAAAACMRRRTTTATHTRATGCPAPT
jgi:hypothetical protein